MKYSWNDAAAYCEDNFGAFVDTNEGFFICPECGEPIYENDWPEHPAWYACPVCETCWEDIK